MEFNFNTLEADIARLSKEVAAHKARPENQDTPEREIIKQVLQPVIKRHAPPNTAATPPREAENEENAILPEYTEFSSPQVKLKIEQLIESTFREGLEPTIKKAVHAGPFIMDAYHDALIDKLYDELKKRKLL
mgnify:FL=1